MNALPAVLLVEDEPISRRFLGEVLRELPATVEAVADGRQALSRVLATRFDLWLIDGNLPDGSGEALLDTLRGHAETPALALTADDSPERARSLRAAGFIEVLLKPIAGASLREAVAARLPSRTAPPRWDDRHALRAAAGREEVAERLRGLFLRELPVIRSDLEQALSRDDDDEAREILHRLKASCGFVGAAELLQASRALADAPRDPEARARFLRASADLLKHPE